MAACLSRRRPIVEEVDGPITVLTREFVGGDELIAGVPEDMGTENLRVPKRRPKEFPKGKGGNRNSEFRRFPKGRYVRMFMSE